MADATRMSAQPTITRLEAYEPPGFRIGHVDLSFRLDPNATIVTARSQFKRRAPTATDLVLNGDGLDLLAIRLNGETLPPDAYACTDHGLVIPNAPNEGVLDIETRIAPATNTALDGLYMSGGRYCTQCEPEGFRRITYFIDRPDNLATFTMRIEAPKADFPILLGNGNPLDSGDLPDGWHYATWDDPIPKPAYLFALVAGALDHVADEFVTKSGRRVALKVYVDPGQASRAHYALDSLKRSMAWDEQVFGREYDLDVFNIVAVRDFNFGAMENKGLNIFNAAYVLADPETATDADYAAIESVVAHEYFHNWTGNRITLRDWFQLCLKEGLTVYRDQEFSADQRSRPVCRIEAVKVLRDRQFAEDLGPFAHPVRPRTYQKIDNFYTATVYEKGAELIRLLRTMIGDDAFFKGMDSYFNTCDGTAATLEDFYAAFQPHTDLDLRPFTQWYEQPGTPILEVARTATPDGAMVRFTQLPPRTACYLPNAVGAPPARAFVPVPLAVTFVALDPIKGDTLSAEQTIIVTDKPVEVPLAATSGKPILSLLHGFSAPVVLVDDHTDDERALLLKSSPDPFARWQAGDQLARNLLLARIKALDTQSALPSADGLLAAYEALIADADKDPEWTALALRLPTEQSLLQSLENADPEQVFLARAGLRAEIGGRLAEKLMALAAKHQDADRADLSGPSAGRRSLFTAAIDLLLATDGVDPRAVQMAIGAVSSCTTMTIRMGMLGALSQGNADDFDGALAQFAVRHATNPLVMDKWFAVQSAAPRADGRARIEALVQHPDFDLSIPNRARAVLASLGMRNPRLFHSDDGWGYRLMGHFILKLDTSNPALSSRLATAFEIWPRLKETTRNQALSTLKTISTQAKSDNLREVIAKVMAN